MKRWMTIIVALAATTACNGEISILDSDGNPADGWEQDKEIDTTKPVDGDDLDDVVDAAQLDVARVTLHRLNRAEYNNTVRDLLGDTTNPADDFPDDDFGYGFNNIADVLSLSPLHLEMYSKAAEDLVNTALAGGAVSAETQRFEAETVGGSVGAVSGDAWNLYSNGSVETVVNFPAAGEYTIRASVRQPTQAGPDPAQSTLTLNSAPLQQFDIPETTFRTIEVTTTIPAGNHSVGVTFDNDYYDPDLGEDRNLHVDYLEVVGPIGATGEPSAQRAAILSCEDDTAACTNEVLGNFGLRAWRRPLTDDELTRLGQFIDVAKGEGLGWEDGIRLALQAILVSPNFLFRVELDPDLEATEAHAIDDFEMASRLSYFIWSTMPDAELFALAEEGRLQEEQVLRDQVRRMLDDPKSVAMIDNFATQWLFIDVIRDFEPDYTLFPNFDEDLREAMRVETRLFFEELLSKNAPISELLLADYTYVNTRLAEHYNMAARTADDSFERVALTGDERRGLLGHSGLMSSLSFSKRTSPVRRGAWVLGNLLCSEPPPAPPGVEGLPAEIDESMTMRERMEQHSTDPACAACHVQMDPIGFGLEDYNAIGEYRTMDNGRPVDSSGTLPDGSTFNGASELAGILAQSPKYADCVTEKMMTYGLGRGVESFDRPQLELLLEELGEDFGFRDLVTEIVLSPAFRMRRGGDLPEAP